MGSLKSIMLSKKVAELANMYCDINDTYDMDKIERFIEKEFA